MAIKRFPFKSRMLVDVCVRAYTCARACVRTFVRACVHACVWACMHSYVRTCVHVYWCVCVCARARVCRNILVLVIVTKRATLYYIRTGYVAGACSDTDCEQLCFPAATGHACGCAIGFTLNADTKSCDSGKRLQKHSYVTLSFNRFQ